MLLSPIVEGLSEDLKKAAALGGDDIRRAADVLVDALGPALRMRMLDALQQASEELTASFPGAEIEMQLQGRDPVLTLTVGRGPGGRSEEFGFGDEETARLTLRLPEGLKSQIERAASNAGVSLNSWLVEAAAQSLHMSPPGGARRGPKRMTGFVRG